QPTDRERHRGHGRRRYHGCAFLTASDPVARMPAMRRSWWRSIVVVGVLLAVADPVRAADPVTAEAPRPGPPAIAGSRAGDYVGQIGPTEGRIAGIHESPLATVLGFAPNFAGFTATILAADRDKFPADLAARVQDKNVRVTGTVTAYRGKPEM